MKSAFGMKSVPSLKLKRNCRQVVTRERYGEIYSLRKLKLKTSRKGESVARLKNREYGDKS